MTAATASRRAPILIWPEMVLTGRFGMLLSAIFTMTWSTVGACALAGAIRIRGRSLIRVPLVMTGMVVIGMLAVNMFFTHVVSHRYVAGKNFLDRELLMPPVQANFLDNDDLPPSRDEFASALDRIRSRGVIPVGIPE